MDTFLTRASEAEYDYLSANFVNLETGKSVFPAYARVKMGDEMVAIIGISTPESYTKSTLAYFQDENGNDIYGFSENEFYATIQQAIDEVTRMGAEVETTKLVDPKTVVVDENSSAEVQSIYTSVEGEIAEYKARVEELNKTVLGSSEVTLTENHPESGEWIQKC